MTPEEVKPIRTFSLPQDENILVIPVSEIGPMLKAAMAERNIHKIVAWYLKADELETMK